MIHPLSKAVKYSVNIDVYSRTAVLYHMFPFFFMIINRRPKERFRDYGELFDTIGNMNIYSKYFLTFLVIRAQYTWMSHYAPPSQLIAL